MKLKILVLERAAELAEEVRSAAARVDPSVEVVACNRVGAVGDILQQEGPFAVVLAGPSLASRSGLRRVTALHEEAPETSILLAFSDRPDASLREIIQAGADDLLRLPFDPDELAIALERSLEIGRRRLTAGGAPKAGAATSSTVPASVPGAPARIFTVSSATGGCGKTFFATNMALYLARHTRKKVVLVDLDLQFGEVSTALRLRPNYTIYDALHRDEGDRLDFGDHLDEYLVQHESGFSVLAAPKDPAEADRIHPADVTRVLEVLRTRADYIVVDTPSALTEIVLAAFDLSEHLFTMATVDLPSVRNMGVFLQTLEKLRIPAENISLLLNKAETDVGLDVGQIVRLFPQGFKAILPYAREVSRSINMGMPVISSDPGSEVSRKLNACFMEFLPEADRTRASENMDTPSKNQGRFKFFGRTANISAGSVS